MNRTTRPRLIVWMALAAATLAAPYALADGERDFVFTDEDGHLVLRFAGTAAGGLDANQLEEVVNVQLSTMVHDRLRADSVFESEAIDAAWAAPMQTRLEHELADAGPALTSIAAECRSSTCRLVVEHAPTYRVAAHQALMAEIQRAIDAFIAADPTTFEPVFLIAAHYQEPGKPYMNVFLYRAAARSLESTGG